MLVAVLLIAALTLPSFAAGTELIANVSPGTYFPDDTFAVAFKLSGNPGFYSATIQVDFNAAALELTEFSRGSAYPGVNFAPNTASGTVVIYGNSVTLNISGDGELFTATFKVKSGAAANTYAITAKLKNGNSKNFINIAAEPIPLGFVGDSVQIENDGSWINPYKDVKESDWYYEAIKFVSSKGIMIGTAPDLFSPELELTRAQMVQILYNIEGKPNSGERFSDVQGGAWYYDAISWASVNGIINGYGNGKFDPDDAITREQFVTVLYNYAKWKRYNINETTSIKQYTDHIEISNYAVEPFIWAVAKGIITGTSGTTLSPKSASTRAQAAIMIKRFVESKSDGKEQTTSTSQTPESSEKSGTVTIGTQSGSLTTGTAGNVTYTVTTANIGNGTYTAKLTGVPSGVTADNLTIRNNSGTLTLNIINNAAAGTYYLSLTVDGAVSSSFTLTINSENEADNTQKSSDATLQSLSVSGISFEFNPNTTKYSADVDNNVTFVTVSAEAANSKATVSGTGTVQLNTGSNTITVSVTAENGAMKAYTIDITRKAKVSRATISVVDPQGTTFLSPTQIEISDGETVYSLLQMTGLNFQTSGNSAYAGVYIESINDWGEFSDGNLSGWMYRVNGVFPKYSCSVYTLKDGDVVEWLFTRDLGADIGGSNYN